mgnify:FL=1
MDGVVMKPISTIQELEQLNFDLIPEDEFWNAGEQKELLIHKVHVYPAKFPSLIAQKAFEYASNYNYEVNRVADIFCGCGTVAVEACRKGYDFYGCDLNPVAVLLAEVKTTQYKRDEIERIGKKIIDNFNRNEHKDTFQSANERLKYWYVESQYNELYHLKQLIDTFDMSDDYHKLFLCIFSSILKPTSKWLTKSIKPQVDPNKEIHCVIETFEKQLKIFIKAIEQEDYKGENEVEIQRMNVLDIEKEAYVDLVVTSPPYVTSYEYADLHQLSSLWLGYASNFTDLRKDSIGSQYGADKTIQWELNDTAKKITEQFPGNSQGAAIARYYSQMENVVKICCKLLRPLGFCVFVIGDTEYKGIRIENAKSLAESMIRKGFVIQQISKRKIANKFLPSHRDANGKFSSNKDDRKIYSQEYIVIGRKL